MMPSRFYYPSEISAGRVIELPANAAHHAARVLRLEQGDAVTLFNGAGGEFAATIARIGKSGAAVMVEKHLAIERESPLSITLAQAVCANEKMDWIVQKGVELGVSRIQPIAANRSVVRLSGERADRRMQHWQQIAISACEQCGRNRVPQVLPLLSLPYWLGGKKGEQHDLNQGHDLCFMLSPSAKQRLRDFPEAVTAATLTLLVGAEGGFAPEEETAAVVAGFIPLRLGGRILRTESAALASIAAMQTLWGDY